MHPPRRVHHPRACVRNSGTQVQGKASQFAPPAAPGPPADSAPTHAPEGEEAEPVEPAPEDNSMPEPPHVRAPWAQLTEEEREEQHAGDELPEHPWHDRVDGGCARMAPEPKHAAEPEPGPVPCMYKAPPQGPNSLHAARWTRRITGHRKKATLAISLLAWVRVVIRRVLLGTSAGCPTRLPAGIRLQMHSASTRHTLPTNALQHTARITPATRATARDAKKATAGRICPATGRMHTHPLGASAPHHASHGDAGPRTTHAVSR